LFEYNNDDAIHKEEYARAAALMAETKNVKFLINNSIQKFLQGKSAVVEGRNVSTIMFPEAEIKVLLFADIETRTIRRLKQLNNDSDYKSVKESLQYRDKVIPSGNGNYDVLVNTSNYNLEDTVSMILRVYYKKNT
jgi:cytidylate kinase